MSNQNPQNNGFSFILAMLVGAILTVGIGLFVYLWNPFQEKKTVTPPDTPMIQQKQPEMVDKPNYEFYDVLKDQKSNQPVASQPAVNARKIVKEPPKVVEEQPVVEKPAESEVTEDLPDLSDENADDTAVETTNNATPKPIITEVKPNKIYFLRISSFDNADDADRRRAQVIMAGVDAQIVKRTLNDGSQIFEVISRVMHTQAQANDARLRLQNNGIESLISEQQNSQ